MKISMINNRESIIAVGRYAFTLSKYISNYTEIDHYLLNQNNYSLELVAQNKRKLLKNLKTNIFFDNLVFKKTRISNLLLDWRLASFLQKDYQIYHFVGNPLNNLAYHPKIKGKTIITVHDLFYLTQPENKIEKTFSRYFIYKSMSKINAHIAISEYTKSEILTHFDNFSEDDIEVIYQGVEDYFTPLERKKIIDLYNKYAIPTDCHLLLHIGSSALRKNNKLLIKVLHNLIINHNQRNIRLVKIGSWDNDSTCLIEKYNLRKYIIQLKNISEFEIVKFYNLADIFLFPSYAEGFGFPPLEAMACGTPVIASNRTSIPEVVGNAGILLDPEDFEGFSDHIIEILNNKRLAKYYSYQGIKKSKSFSWETTAKKTLELYETLM